MVLPFVSVVVPVLDRAGMIGTLLDSLAAQWYPADRHEILVVDNGSTDGTQGVVERYPVTLLSETSRRSSYAARNRGIAAGRGELVAFIDSDCVADPGWLAALVEGSDDPTYGAFAGEVVAFAPSSRPERFLARRRVAQHASMLRHPYLPCVTTSNVAYRRAALDRIGAFDAELRSGGDVDLAWRMQEQTPYRIAYRPAAIVAHRNRSTVPAMWRQQQLYGEGIAALERRHPTFYRDYSARAGSPLWWNALYQLKRLPAVPRARWFRGVRGADAVAFLLYDVLLEIAFNRGVRRGRRDTR
jgi:glycosyltransferase involved in cell wall biosynthesis